MRCRGEGSCCNSHRSQLVALLSPGCRNLGEPREPYHGFVEAVVPGVAHAPTLNLGPPVSHAQLGSPTAPSSAASTLQVNEQERGVLGGGHVSEV